MRRNILAAFYIFLKGTRIMIKRIVTIQDISCVGKCSLTVALPIISAMGVETAIIPTAVLSTHTMFSGFTCKDLTDQIVPIAEHWKKEKFHFDAIYTGYLGSFEQISIVSKFFEEFKTPDNLIVVDPVMADNGKLYPAFDEDYAKENAKLCGKADLIVPNITEASFMTGLPYKTEYDRSYILDMLKALAQLGPKYAVLTGVSFHPDRIGVMGMNCETGERRHLLLHGGWSADQRKVHAGSLQDRLRLYQGDHRLYLPHPRHQFLRCGFRDHASGSGRPDQPLRCGADQTLRYGRAAAGHDFAKRALF